MVNIKNLRLTGRLIIAVFITVSLALIIPFHHHDDNEEHDDCQICQTAILPALTEQSFELAPLVLILIAVLVSFVITPLEVCTHSVLRIRAPPSRFLPA